MVRIRQLGVSLILAAGLAACATGPAPVQPVVDDAFDASDWRGYAWLESPGRIDASTETRVDFDALGARMEGAIRTALTAKGYGQRRDADAADFLVGYAVHITRDDPPADAGAPAQGCGLQTGQLAALCAWYEAEGRFLRLVDGTISIYVVDSDSDAIVWAAQSDQAAGRASDEEFDAVVDAAVAETLAAFPDAGR